MQIGKGFGGVGKLQGASSHGVLLALFVLVLLALLVVPLPTFVLDLLLVSNLVLSLILLLLALFLEGYRGLYTFPTILLLSTLFRLSLNVASTRLILLYGDTGRDAAGEVIEAFGNLVVQGDFVVGVVIFAIIATVNFLVITKGAGRVAEVAARFTLDSLPGKQFAIDADLRNGSITREQAQLERSELERESQFYGAMDGAIKFVQGDALAAIIIVFINALGGVSIGISRGLPAAEALQTFGVLTMGDGLVHLIPAVLISVCAGLVTTKVGGSQRRKRSGNDRLGPSSPIAQAAVADLSTGEAVITQITRDPRVIIIAAVVLLALGLLPGMPFVPFALIASLLIAAVVLPQRAASVDKHQQSYDTKMAGPVPTDLPTIAYETGAPSVLRVELPSDPSDSPLLTGRRQRGVGTLAREELLTAFRSFQADVFQRRGFLVPEPEVVESDGVSRIYVRGRIVYSQRLPENAIFVLLDEESAAISALTTVEAGQHPLTLAAGFWCSRNQSAERALRDAGIGVFSKHEFLALQIIASALGNVSELFGVEQTRAMLSGVRVSAPALYEEVIEKGLLTVIELSELLGRLLKERLSIRDPALILDTVARAAAVRQVGEDRAAYVDYLHALLRKVLAKHALAATAERELSSSFVLGPDLQEKFREAALDAETGEFGVAFTPQDETSLRDRIDSVFGAAVSRGATPVTVIVPADIRPFVEDFLADQFSSREWYRTLAFEELDGRCNLQTVGVLE